MTIVISKSVLDRVVSELLGYVTKRESKTKKYQ